ncbi:hypothetical protein IFM47457_04956 [Aspergillus lentulus]|nr:hypothetical protein IFM47457_04956 [Aspergillus lentulus]
MAITIPNREEFGKASRIERDLEWVSRNDVDVVKDVTSEARQNAILLYRRGVEYTESCESCANGAGTVRRCVSAQEYPDTSTQS